MPKLSIITLTWNQLEKATKPYIKNLYEYTNEDDFELIIVDNGSTDGTVEYLKQLEKEKTNIKVIYNSENLGYSKGNNQGIKIAKGGIIGLFNNDIYFNDKEWLKKMLNFIKTAENPGLISPFMLISDDCNLSQYFENKYKRLKNEYEKVIDVFFCCVLFKRELVDEIGLLDENFSPAFFEDNDYSIRSIKEGKYNYVFNEVFIYHNCSQTSKIFSKTKNDLLDRNKNYYVSKHGFLVEYIYNQKYKYGQLAAKQKRTEKCLFWFLVNLELKLEERFEKIFRGLIRKLK